LLSVFVPGFLMAKKIDNETAVNIAYLTEVGGGVTSAFD